jgi:hypothetical protein
MGVGPRTICGQGWSRYLTSLWLLSVCFFIKALNISSLLAFLIHTAHGGPRYSSFLATPYDDRVAFQAGVVKPVIFSPRRAVVIVVRYISITRVFILYPKLSF